LEINNNLTDKQMTRELHDRRDEFEKAYFKYYVWAKDNFMTKWGNDCGRLDNAVSYAVWFVKDSNRADQMFKWLMDRDEMSNIFIGLSVSFEYDVASMNNRTKGYHISTYPTHEHRCFKD